jgi:hypothetical protein
MSLTEKSLRGLHFVAKIVAASHQAGGAAWIGRPPEIERYID